MDYKQEIVLFDCGKRDEDIIEIYSYIINENPKFFGEENMSIQIENNVYDLKILIEEVEIIMRLIQAEWIQIQGTTISGLPIPCNDISNSRQLINRYVNAIKMSIMYNLIHQKRYKSILSKSIEDFLKFYVPLYELDNDLLLKLTAVNKINKCPLYHYLHSSLDIQCNFLILNLIIQAPLFEQVECIMKELVALCLNNFKRQHNSGIFICPCIKYFWLLIQFVVEKTNPTDNIFWTIFNRLLINEEPSFCIFLLKEVAYLQSLNCKLISEGITCSRIKANYEFLENKLKVFLLKARSSSLLQHMKLLKSLLIKLWVKDGRIDIYHLIWDYYSKRLNISDKRYTNVSAIQFSKLIDNVIFDSEEDFTEDFELFLNLLISHLKKYPTHWGKMKGRIYSQLSLNKLKELNETGATRIILLFISLSHLYYEEGVKKLLPLCEIIFKEKDYPEIWNVYMCFMLQQLKENKSLEKTAPLMLKLLERAVEDNQKYYLINGFFINFKHILNMNIRMDLYQWLFFSFKLDKYVLSCYYADLNLALEVIALLLEKVNTSDLWPLWKTVFKVYIYPALKKLSTTQNAPKILGTICGHLHFLFPDIANENFKLFTSDQVSSKISAAFVIVILDDYPNKFVLMPHQIPSILQTWIRDCFLSNNACKTLTNSVLNLDVFPPLLKDHVKSASNPLFALIEYLGSDIKEFIYSSKIHILCEFLFGYTDKWLINYLNSSQNESVVLDIYNFISLAFIHCGPLLYNSKKQSSPLTNLIQALLLPTELLIGRSPHIFVLEGMKKTWPTFFEALINLNTNNDMYLERTLRDMITKYIPYFSTVDSPMIKCFQKDTTATVFLEKISSCFFKHPIKESDVNVLKVSKILKSFIESNTSVHLMQIIVKCTLYGLFEAVIFYTQRNVPISVIKSISDSPLYSEISNDFCNAIISIMEKHLALNTINCFQLMFILAGFVPTDMKNILNTIKQKVSNVERLRGVGFDKNLRMQLEKLENIVKDNLKCT